MSSSKRVFLHYNDLPDNVELKGDIAVDTEAMGLQIHRDRLCLVQICDSEKNVHLVAFENGNNYLATNLKSCFEDKSRQKIFHYARFDVAIIKHYLGVNVSNIFCTKIASKLVRTYTDYHGLRSIVNELLGVDLRKDQQCTYWGAQQITEAQKHYAANDVIYLHAIRSKLQVMLKREGRVDIAQSYFDFLDTIVDIDLQGFRGDIFSH
ncbi:MAG: ribonuclease D [Alphaproteobacteria bacterium]|nr:ribonuclease D [Rickettsiales bacterium]